MIAFSVEWTALSIEKRPAGTGRPGFGGCRCIRTVPQ